MFMPEAERGPLLGEPAPHFEQISQKTGRKKKQHLWTVFISHPYDLMPFLRIKTVNYILCKREIKVVALADLQGEEMLREGNVLEKYMVKHNFSFIDDTEGVISGSYGLAAAGEGEEPVKGLFVIDPKGVLRMKIFSPLSAERNFPDVMALIDALQTAFSREEKKGEKSPAEDAVYSGLAGFRGEDFQKI